MNQAKKLGLLTVAGAILATSAVTALVKRNQDGALPALPEQSVSAWDLVYARPFVLDTGYTHWWRLEQPTVTAGYLLVLAVDPELAVPRQTYEPVLYVGAQTAERVNTGRHEGYVVTLVPAELGPNGVPELDLAAQPIFYGTPELPERIDAARARAELELARDEGIVPMPETTVKAALAKGGDVLRLADRTALDGVLADVIEQYAPQEVDLIRGMRAPLVR